MEDRVRLLEITQAVQAEKIDRLTEAVEANTAAVTELTKIVSASKGGWLVLAGMAGVIGFILNLIVAWFGGKSGG